MSHLRGHSRSHRRAVWLTALACGAPKSYRVKPGKHKFSVQALNGGVPDPTPATFGFKVVRKR